MISDFIYKYYIDPIRYEQPYNAIETITYALLLIAALYLIYRWFVRSKFDLDAKFVLATVPYIIFGGVLRVVQDTHVIKSDAQFLIVTPFIYFVIFFYTFGILLLTRWMERQGFVDSYVKIYAGAGILSILVASLVLIAWSSGLHGIHPEILVIILSMAAAATLAVFLFMRYALKWEYVRDPLYITLLFGQLLDASATSYGIDFHPVVHYIEQHVVGSTLMEWTHTAFVMFPLKLLVLFPAIYIMQLYRKEANPAFWHLVLLAMIVVGFAPGVRDMVRMVLYV